MEKSTNKTFLHVKETIGVLALFKGATLVLSDSVFGFGLLLLGAVLLVLALLYRDPREQFRSFAVFFSLCASAFVFAFETNYTIEIALVSGYLGFILFVVKFFLDVAAENAHNEE